MRQLLAQQREKLHSKGESHQVEIQMQKTFANQMANTESNSVLKPKKPIDVFVLQGGSVISSVFEIFVLSMVRISDM